jgi:hypothetical protein
MFEGTSSTNYKENLTDFSKVIRNHIESLQAKINSRKKDIEVNEIEILKLTSAMEELQEVNKELFNS